MRGAPDVVAVTAVEAGEFVPRAVDDDRRRREPRRQVVGHGGAGVAEDPIGRVLGVIGAGRPGSQQGTDDGEGGEAAEDQTLHFRPLFCR